MSTGERNRMRGLDSRLRGNDGCGRARARGGEYIRMLGGARVRGAAR